MSITYYELANALLQKPLADLIIYCAGKEHYSAMVNGVIEGYSANVWSDSVDNVVSVVTLALKDAVDRQEITIDRATALQDRLTTALDN